jgi:hypothetical protein
MCVREREREREREMCRRRGCETKEGSWYWFIGAGEKRWKNAWDVLLDMSARTYCTVYSQRRILPNFSHHHVSKSMLRRHYPRVRFIFKLNQYLFVDLITCSDVNL